MTNNGQNNMGIKTEYFMELNVGNTEIVDCLKAATLCSDIAVAVASLAESNPDMLG